MLKPILFGLVFVFSLMIVACAGQSPSGNMDHYIDSAAVTKRITTKLHDNLGASGAGIRVRAYRDEVLLSGYVENQAVRHRAADIAASVDNVKHVRNDLMVK